MRTYEEILEDIKTNNKKSFELKKELRNFRLGELVNYTGKCLKISFNENFDYILVDNVDLSVETVCFRGLLIKSCFSNFKDSNYFEIDDFGEIRIPLSNYKNYIQELNKEDFKKEILEIYNNSINIILDRLK